MNEYFWFPINPTVIHKAVKNSRDPFNNKFVFKAISYQAFQKDI